MAPMPPGNFLAGQDIHQITSRVRAHMIVDEVPHKLWQTFQIYRNRVTLPKTFGR